jgi:hypothetical protein
MQDKKKHNNRVFAVKRFLIYFNNVPQSLELIWKAFFSIKRVRVAYTLYQ